jgi:hypothetical protein
MPGFSGIGFFLDFSLLRNYAGRQELGARNFSGVIGL